MDPRFSSTYRPNHGSVGCYPSDVELIQSMNSLSAPTMPPAPAPRDGDPPPPNPGVGPARAPGARRLLVLAGTISLAAVALLVGIRWWQGRSSLSITDDAFVEAHIVNLAPEMVSGRIVRLLVDENDRVERGQVVAEIDPVPYRDKVSAGRVEAGGREAGAGPAAGRPRPPPARGADPDRDRPAGPGDGGREPVQGRVVGGAHRGRRREGDRRGPGRREGRQGRPAPGPAGPEAVHEPPEGRLRDPPGAGGIDPVARLRRGPARAGRGQARQGDRVEDPGRGRPELARGGPGRRPAGRPRAVDLSETGQRPDPRGRAAGGGQGGGRGGGPPGPGGGRARPGVHQGPRPDLRRRGPAVPQPRRLRLGGRRGPEPVRPGPALRHGQPRGDPPARRRARRAGPARRRRLRRAVPGPRRLGQQVDRGAVRADAPERRLGRVHQGRPARPGPDRDRAGRPMARAPGRALGPGGHRARPGRPGLGRAGRPADGRVRGPLQPARGAASARPESSTGDPPGGSAR